MQHCVSFSMLIARRPMLKWHAHAFVPRCEFLKAYFLADGTQSLGIRAAGTSNHRVVEVVNPATEEKLDEVAVDSSVTVEQMGQQALRAFKDWSRTSYTHRRDVVLRYAQLLRSNARELGQLMARETGKPLTQAVAEARGGAQRVQALVELADQLEWEEAVSVGPAAAASAAGGATSSWRRERIAWVPAGVVADISSFNYPLILAGNVSVAALLMGNTVLAKPSQHALLIGRRLSALLHEAGVPKAAHAVCAGGAETGSAVAMCGAISQLCFTGSHAAGTSVAATAASRCVPAVLELGGKDKVYVDSDVADIRQVAAAIADAAFANSGQTCSAPRLVLVHEAIADEFALRLEDRVCGYKIGDPLQSDVFMGPLISRQAVQEVQEAAKDALHLGGHKLFALRQLKQHSMPGKGYFAHPQVISLHKASGALGRMRMLTQEGPFGPLLALLPVKGWRQALDVMAADKRFGLTASVFSADEELALRMLHKLDVGTGYVNGCSEMSALLPWSGRQQSGMGCTLGLHSLRATFLRPKSLLLRRPAPLPLVEKRPHIHLSPLPGTHHKAQPGHAHRSDQLHVHSELVRPGRSAGEEEQQR